MTHASTFGSLKAAKLLPAAAVAQLGGEQRGDRADVLLGHAQAMVGHRAGEREAALDDIEPRHRFLRLAEPAAARGESGDGLQRALGRAEEIGSRARR